MSSHDFIDKDETETTASRRIARSDQIHRQKPDQVRVTYPE